LRIAILADTDSRKKWAYNVASYFPESNITLFLDFSESIDILILALGGGANYKFLLSFHHYIKETNPRKRPLIISGFNGSTDTSNIHALLCRLGSDYICLNSQKDYEAFSEQLKKLNFPNHTLQLTGMAKDYKYFESKEKDKIVFFAQPDVPKTKRERVYIVKKLEELATKFPDKQVYIKPRSIKGTKNITHKEKYYYQDIVKELKVKYVNLIYDDVEVLLQTIYLSITVGSTVAFESIYNNINTVVLSDFGIRQEYGNHHFIGSGCLLSFEELLNGKIPVIDFEWENKYVLIDENKFHKLVFLVLSKIKEQNKDKLMLPMMPLFYNKDKYPYYYHNSFRINIGVRPKKWNFSYFILNLFDLMKKTGAKIITFYDN